MIYRLLGLVISLGLVLIVTAAFAILFYCMWRRTEIELLEVESRHELLLGKIHELGGDSAGITLGASDRWVGMRMDRAERRA